MFMHDRPLRSVAILCLIASLSAPASAAIPTPGPDSGYCSKSAQACQAIEDMLDDGDANYGNGVESFSGSIMEKQTFVQCYQNYRQATMDLAHLYQTAWQGYHAAGMSVAAAKNKAVEQYLTPSKTLYGHFEDCITRMNYKMK